MHKIRMSDWLTDDELTRVDGATDRELRDLYMLCWERRHKKRQSMMFLLLTILTALVVIIYTVLYLVIIDHSPN